MSDRAHGQVQIQQKTWTGLSSQRNLLQRTCACGQHTIAGGECSSCRNKQSPLLRSQRVFTTPSTVQGSSPAQVNDPPLNTAFDRSSRFGHDFSRIPVYSSHSPVLQTKLMVNQPGDQHEQEADRVAEQVMRMPVPQLQRACDCGGSCAMCQTEEPKQEDKILQTKHIQSNDTGQTAVPPIVHEVLRSPGQPLDTTTRAFMEPRFGYDFSRVRVHTDAHAADSARSINAFAYTIGGDIVFGTRQYNPETSAGRQLLAHELTHVVQQSNSHNTIYRKGDPSAKGGGITNPNPIIAFAHDWNRFSE